jgi:hypothetical protein
MIMWIYVRNPYLVRKRFLKLAKSGILFSSLDRRWFSAGIPVSSINKTDHHDITETLSKVALSTL